MIRRDHEFKGPVPLSMDIISVTFGQTLQKDRLRRSSNQSFLLILLVMTLFLILAAYESQLRASLIAVDVEKPVDNTEV